MKLLYSSHCLTRNYQVQAGEKHTTKRSIFSSGRHLPRSSPPIMYKGLYWILLLREKHLGCCGADHKLADDLRPVSESADRRTFIEFLRDHDGVLRHKPQAVKAAEIKPGMCLAAYC